MKVVCDNCRAVYKIPDEKLVKPVNKATCRNCGHRMLIPRPRAGADPDERTLVTAVPPTPPPAPPRDAVADEDATLPAQSVAPPSPPGHGGAFDPGGIAPSDEAPTPRPPVSRSATQQEPPRTQAPVAEIGTPTPSALSRSTQPAPASPPGYNPAGDMTLALFGAIAAITGAFILALVPATMPGISLLPLAAVFLGLTVAMTGGFVTVLVLLTGSRGRRRASRIMSIFSGGVLATLVALIIAVIVPLGMRSIMGLAGSDEVPMAEGTPMIPTPPPRVLEPVPEPADDASAEAGPEDEATDAPADDALDAEDPEPTEDSPPPTSTRTTASTTAPATTRTTTPTPTTRRTTTTRTPAPEPDPEPAVRVTRAPLSERGRDGVADEAVLDDFDLGERGSLDADAERSSRRERDRSTTTTTTSRSTASDKPRTVPMEVIDIMLRNNVDIKKCFYNHMKAEGSLPPQVKVRFTIEPDGSVSAAGVTDTDYAGTELDRCLSRTIRGLTFPETSGPASKITYPFVL